MENKILMGKGKEYSAATKEVEADFNAWLQASGINVTDFIRAVDGEDFYLTYLADQDAAIIVLHKADGEIAMPLIWQKESGIALESFKLDAALLLLLVREKCSNHRSKVKITTFVKENLCINTR